jgi:CubicO group peptidase (beta-lactamase class C family)
VSTGPPSFHVASLSKQFTAVSVALLAREGRLSLDEDVRMYLPEVPDFGHTITPSVHPVVATWQRKTGFADALAFAPHYRADRPARAPSSLWWRQDGHPAARHL